MVTSWLSEEIDLSLTSFELGGIVVCM